MSERLPQGRGLLRGQAAGSSVQWWGGEGARHPRMDRPRETLCSAELGVPGSPVGLCPCTGGAVLWDASVPWCFCSVRRRGLGSVPRAPCLVTCTDVERMGQWWSIPGKAWQCCPLWGETEVLPSHCFQSCFKALWVVRRWEQLWHPPRLWCLSPITLCAVSMCSAGAREPGRSGGCSSPPAGDAFSPVSSTSRADGEQNRPGPPYSSKALTPGASSSGGADSALALLGSSSPPAHT